MDLFRRLRGRKVKSKSKSGDSISERSVNPSEFDDANKNESDSSLGSHGDRLGAQSDPGRNTSVVSKFGISQLGLVPPALRSRQSSRDRRADPLGLTVLHCPSTPRLADIVFVHGLGGSSHATWSKNGDPDLCWPQKWLPSDPDVSFARVLTFGYDAHFASTGPASISNIRDFAKALLFDMRFGRDEFGQDLGIGQVPIVFVVHSMGGLIFKKAFLMGQNDPEYSSVIDQIRSVMFLSTPHRGTNLANILNGLLSVSLAGHTSKEYISELNKDSAMIEDVNENFRNIAPRLQIFSFYETLETSVAFRSLMVLDKESSILGYPGEISRPLDADHHTVCKFSTMNDPNYRSVRSALINALSDYRYEQIQSVRSKSTNDTRLVKELLGIHGLVDEDYAELQSQWQPGTCDSLLTVPAVVDWIQDSTQSSILWAYAQPGSGKSIYCAYLINHLKKSGSFCAYFFFKFMDSMKRSLKSALLTLALQMAEDMPTYKALLADFYRDGLRLEKADGKMVWQRLFLSALSAIEASRPVYWVVDALDESDSASSVVEMLSNITMLRLPIRLFATSRDLPSISNAFSRISISPVLRISLDDNATDIRFCAAKGIEHMLGSQSKKQDIIDQISQRARGNFLWVTLATKQITHCHSSDEVQEALESLPPGMDALYGRMETYVGSLTRQADKKLAMIILTWTVFARRPLTKTELLSILQPDFSEPINFRHTVSEVCGHFVVIDSSDRVTLVHQTAREHLLNTTRLPYLLDPAVAHESLFQKSIRIFFDTGVRSKLRQASIPAFYDYAATSWPYHLGSITSTPDNALNLLMKFFRGPHVLPWIDTLAQSKQLKVLIYASRHLSSFVRRRRKLDAPKMPLLHRLSDLSLLEAWAIDLLKIAGKFSNRLLQDPPGIYKYITEFCPSNSMIYRAGNIVNKEVRITGITNAEWDDRLVRVSVGSGNQASMLSCCGRYLAIATGGGSLYVWNALTFELLWKLDLEQHVFRICFNSNGESLLAYTFANTSIWQSSSGRELRRFPNRSNIKPLCIAFTENDKKVMIASDSREILEARLDVKDQTPNWAAVGTTVMREDTAIAGTFLNSPTALAFSPDMSDLAAAYRGFPLTVWSLNDARQVSRCRRRTGLGKMPQKSWTGVNKICWHPTSGDLLGIYTDGMVFKWHPIQETHDELKSMENNATPSEIECSPDGTVFATSDVNGTVRLYNFQHFSLIYQLASEDLITALCFSPDSRRFYDLRGSYCDAWEPNVLIRMSGSEEPVPDVETEAGSTIVSFSASEAFVDAPTPITTLAFWQQGELLYTGDDEGKVEILDMDLEMRQEICGPGTQMCIDRIACSESGKYFAYTNLEGSLVILQLEEAVDKSTCRPPRYRRILETAICSETEPVQQLFFSPDSTCLLSASQSSAQVWMMDSNLAGPSSSSVVETKSRRWVNHPYQSGQLLSITTQDIYICAWSSLEILYQRSLTLHEQVLTSDHPDTGMRPESVRNESSQNALRCLSQERQMIEDVIISQDQSQLLLVMFEYDHFSRRRSKVYVLHTQKLTLGKKYERVAIVADSITHSIAGSILKPLAVLKSNKLVFLDTSLWVCTSNLRGDDLRAEHQIKKHYFLPTDWMSDEGLKMCCMTSDGTLLLPRKGEVAVIRSSLNDDW